MIDLHTHILPGIDDGARNFDDSLAILRELQAQGVTKVFATPHYIEGTNYVSSRKDNMRLIRELKRRIKAEKIKVEIFLGNEIYIDREILELLKKKEISTLNNSKYLLVELPMSGVFPNAEDILVELKNSGYKVILAHPERYVAMQKDFDKIVYLYERGILLQCNTGSYIGKYGRRAKKTAIKLAKNKMIFGLGSDTHRAGRSNGVELALKKLAKYYGEKELKKILITNPRKIII